MKYRSLDGGDQKMARIIGFAEIHGVLIGVIMDFSYWKWELIC
jgi:hypothetical protein